MQSSGRSPWRRPSGFGGNSSAAAESEVVVELIVKVESGMHLENESAHVAHVERRDHNVHTFAAELKTTISSESHRWRSKTIETINFLSAAALSYQH